MTNSRTVAALVIEPDGTARMTEVAPDWRALSALVGGYLTMIRPATDTFGEWHAYVDEEALLKTGVAPNPAGTAFARSIGWESPEPMLLGPMVFLGSGGTGEDAGADEADVPIEVVSAAVRLYGLEA